LGKVSDLQSLAGLHTAGQRFKRAGQRLDQGGLALAVGAEQTDALAVADRQRHPAYDGLVARGGSVAAIHGLHHQHRIGRRVRLAKHETEAGGELHRRQLLHFFQRLDAALGLLRLAGLGLEAGDEALQVRDLQLLFLKPGLLQFQLLRAQDFKGRVIAAVAGQLHLVDVQHDVADRIQEFAIMRNHDQGAGIAPQPVLQPDDGIQIKMVGRLVEQQQVGRAHQGLGQIQPHAPAAGECRNAVAGLRYGEPQTQQQGLGAGGGGIAIGIRIGGVGVRFGAPSPQAAAAAMRASAARSGVSPSST